MPFLIEEAGPRLAAIVVGLWCARALWRGFSNGAIAFESDVVVGAVLDPETEVRRNVAPFQYWTAMVLQAVALLACLFVAVFGWS